MFTSYVAHEREARTRCSPIRGAVAIRRGFEEEAAHRLGLAEQRFVSRISLLAPPALVVENNDALGRAPHVRRDEADAGIKFSGMPLDFGNNPPRH
jgi:hypothetical protein